MIECPLNRTGGYEAARALLELAEPPTALVADNNLAGAGAFRAIVESGKQLGTEISLIVYDGVPPDVASSHTVTSVAQSTGEASGRVIAELILATIAGKKPEPRLAQAHIEPGDTDGPPR